MGAFVFNSISRRQFLEASLGGVAAAAVAGFGQNARAAVGEPSVAFFLVGDTHYLADKENPDRLDAASATTNARLIDTLNRLPGTAIPQSAGGGTVAHPNGLVHAGDLIDSGDKNGGVFPAMQQTEWLGFAADYGLDGSDGRLKFPVYEVYGNHDSPRGDGPVIEQIIKRNKTRPGVANVSDNGAHYSWDWGSIHFVNLGIVVGAVPQVARRRRYNPLDSLEFLVADLAGQVGTSGRPIVVAHHVDVARYSAPPKPDAPATSAEWDPADVQGYYKALQGYNVVAILYGHTHARNVYRWDGTPKKSDQGLSVFNVDNSAHFASMRQGILYFHLRGDELIVRELTTADGWQSADWTPQTWSTCCAVKP
jgi:predicted phosphodiesterase